MVAARTAERASGCPAVGRAEPCPAHRMAAWIAFTRPRNRRLRWRRLVRHTRRSSNSSRPGPTAHPAGRRAGRRLTTRLGLRMRGDTQLLLSIAVALPVFAVEGISESPRRALGLLAPLVLVAAQVWLTAIRSQPRWLNTARLALCLAFIAMANVWVDSSGTWPLSALAIPVVALAAANGDRGGLARCPRRHGRHARAAGAAHARCRRAPIGVRRRDGRPGDRLRQPARRCQPGALGRQAPPGKPARAASCSRAGGGGVGRPAARSRRPDAGRRSTA